MGAMRAIIPERAVIWLGHYSILLLLAAVIASAAYDAAGRPGGAADWALDALWLAWVAAYMADSTRHQERLCERCIAASPLDPQASVARWRPALRLHHEKRAMTAVFGGILAWDFTGGVLFRHPPAWALALDAVTVLVLGAAYAVSWQHRRLYPWCPFCRWDEGGDHEVSPDVPAPAVTR